MFYSPKFPIPCFIEYYNIHGNHWQSISHIEIWILSHDFQRFAMGFLFTIETTSRSPAPPFPLAPGQNHIPRKLFVNAEAVGLGIHRLLVSGLGIDVPKDVPWSMSLDVSHHPTGDILGYFRSGCDELSHIPLSIESWLVDRDSPIYYCNSQYIG